MNDAQAKATTSSRAAGLLLFEPNLKVLDYLVRLLGERYPVRSQSSADDLLETLRSPLPLDLLLFAFDSVERSAELLRQVRELRPQLPIVALALSVDKLAYEALARSAVADIVLKPMLENLAPAIEQSLQRSPEVLPEVEESTLDDSRSFVRSSQRMREIEAQAALVARTDIPVLILGESGTGKDILATYTHKRSLRAKRTLMKINCAAMPAELLESELFGYEEGAFTGAVKAKQGKFEIANGGTIFLDEIGEMPASLQAKLLHVLQDGSYFRLGGRAPLKADVRVIAATNVNIKQAIAAKTFREDLYYRLNGLTLILPPLRDRLEELPALTQHFLRKSAERHGLQPQVLSSSMLEGLARYSWPGNLRELENVITRFLILQDENAILSELKVDGGVTREAVRAVSSMPNGEERGLKDLARSVKGSAEAAVIATALERTGWNRRAAAQELQISYKALLYKIKQYELLPKLPKSAA